MDTAPAREMLRAPVTIQVTEEHHIARARQVAKALAETVGLGRVAAFEIAISISELATNLVFHATRGGTITVLAVYRNGDVGVEIIAEDDGPGIPDVRLAMQDGFTTNGGLGGGLPGVERLMDEFEITSTASTGTRIVARRWQRCR